MELEREGVVLRAPRRAAHVAVRRALPDLVQKVLPKIRSMAGKMRARGAIDCDDLIQVGMLAALKANARFDPKKGLWWPYMVQRVYGAMVDEMRRADHISRNYRRRGHIDGRVLPMLMSLQTSDPRLVPTDIPVKPRRFGAEAVDQVDLWRQVHATLKPRQAKVIELYFRFDLTLRTIGDVLGISESYASMIWRQAVRRLRTRWTLAERKKA